jgi:hypothetical protein
VRIQLTDEETKALDNPEELKKLCRKETDAFERLMRQQDSTFGSLAGFERMAIQSYLYQKLRGRLNEENPTDSLSEGRKDG